MGLTTSEKLHRYLAGDRIFIYPVAKLQIVTIIYKNILVIDNNFIRKHSDYLWLVRFDSTKVTLKFMQRLALILSFLLLIPGLGIAQTDPPDAAALRSWV